MSENKPGLLDELSRWLELDERKSDPASAGPADVANRKLDQLQEELAMEEDPKRRAELESQIKLINEQEELAVQPTNVLGPY